jgi:septum formation protein
VAIIDSTSGAVYSGGVTVRLKMRQLSEEMVECYLERDNPVGAAGAYLLEGAGIALFDAIEGSDESAVVGLPLLLVCELLRSHGVEPLS